ncbi:hypothetical protein KHA80_06140 [Anaerobacillus sp. HL2]|nr:hypothetical protein KHA80_06140 [Anaerobacillus sp. HL2]
MKNISKIITPEEFVNEQNIIWHMDDPVADPAAVPLYFVAKEASKHVKKVVLSGEGADELFGGYNIYREPLALKWINKVPRLMKFLNEQTCSSFPEGIKGRNYILRGTFMPLSERC